jgi:uncharacterized membrane protein
MRTWSALACAAMAGACSPGDAGGTNEHSAVRDLPPTAAGPVGNSMVVGPPPAAPDKQIASASPCLLQDGNPVKQRFRATGTEPFWAAEVQGRCVTYSTPDDRQGMRIWTRVADGPDGPVWNGELNGRQFQLYVTPSAGCSNGMSDRRYPFDAVLRVGGETRRGCAYRP